MAKMSAASEFSHRLVTRSSTQTKLSPQLKSRLKTKAHSDSEGSVESNSLSVESGNLKTVKDNKAAKRRRGSEWEILEGLREGQRYDNKPQVFTGYLHKKRKWPLKGWHKRYFVIDKGILVYARGPGDITRGKIHGSVDIGLSVISTKSKSKRIDIDAEEFIYHLKAKRLDNFIKWLEQLKKHRLYRQHLLTFGTRDTTCNDCDNTNYQPTSIPLTPPNNVSPSRDNSLPRGMLGNSTPVGGRLAVWLIDSSPMLESLHKDLKQIGQNITQLAKILDQMSSFSVTVDSENASDGFSPNVKKDRKKFGLRKKKSNKGSSVDLASSSPNDNPSPSLNTSFTLSTSPQSVFLSSSQTCLTSNSVISTAANRPQSLPGSEHLQQFGNSLDIKNTLTPEYQIKEDFVVLAKDVHTSLKTTLFRLTSECDRLKTACESECSQILNINPNVLVTLRHSLNQALVQNNDLKNRLNRVHEIADLADLSSVGPASDGLQKPLAGSLSYSSSCLSASEFFDAEDNHSKCEEIEKKDNTGDNTESSSENNSLSSEEGEENSMSSENSEVGTEYSLTKVTGQMGSVTGRRTKLPAPRPNTEGCSLWNILCKNIGKDLSQVSMPVALNEPLNMLQRMCEELEYSELLDKAAELDDPYERMVYVAAFAVSSYGSGYFRAGSKPFNPLLGETYECIREDKGFKYISEQVSHHPPISVCHAESRNFIFWQDVRIKTKFWGKSMEFQPAGTTNLFLPSVDEKYMYNKVTTCVHNLFSGQRWVDQYGELKITASSGIACKLTFVKASYWSAKRHEIHGCVTSPDGKVVRNLFGKWSEALYCGVAPSAKCIWRPGTMPEDYELYYGFTRFAMELNELDPEMAKYLPPTDTRFRPDQRLLEEGDLQGAENLKLVLEQSQRERRKRREEEENEQLCEGRWFSRHITPSGEETWTYNNKYWEMRKSPGFVNMQFDPLW